MPSNAVSMTIDAAQLRAAEAMLRDIPKAFPLAQAGAINETLKELETATNRRIRETRVAIKRKDLDPYITIQTAKISGASGRLTVKESTRIPLRFFGAKEKKSRGKKKVGLGVAYTIRTGERKVSPHAFIVGKFAGNVYQRAPGAKRLPIIKQRGPSAWGLVVKNKIDTQAIADAPALLRKNLEQRVAFYIKRHAGLIPGYGPGGVPLNSKQLPAGGGA